MDRSDTEAIKADTITLNQAVRRAREIGSIVHRLGGHFMPTSRASLARSEWWQIATEDYRIATREDGGWLYEALEEDGSGLAVWSYDDKARVLYID